jgi:hypothetical protein
VFRFHQPHLAMGRTKWKRSAYWVGTIVCYEPVEVGTSIGEWIKCRQIERRISLPPTVLADNDSRIEACIKFRAHPHPTMRCRYLYPVAVLDIPDIGRIGVYGDFWAGKALPQRRNVSVRGMAILRHLGGSQNKPKTIIRRAV